MEVMVSYTPVRLSWITEDNQRWSTRLVYAKVNPKINQLTKHFHKLTRLRVTKLAGAGMFISRFD